MLCLRIGLIRRDEWDRRTRRRCVRGRRSVIGDALVRFEAGEQVHACIEVVVHLALVIPVLAFALREAHIFHILRRKRWVSFRALPAGRACADALEFGFGLREHAVDEPVDLLAVVRRRLRLRRREPLALGALRVPVEFLELGFGLRLPRHTPELGDVVLGLLVGHGLFKAFECGVHLWDGIATLDDVERGVLNVAAVQLNAIGLIQRVRLLQESVDLMDVIPLLRLPTRAIIVVPSASS